MKTINHRPCCDACWGDGYVHDIFTGERMYGDACDGTGFDLYYRPKNDQDMGRISIGSHSAVQAVQTASADEER